MKVYVTHDNGGRITGFYTSDLHPTPPGGAVEIPEADWHAARSDAGAWRLDPSETRLIPAPAPPAAERLAARRQALRGRVLAMQQEQARLAALLARNLAADLAAIDQAPGTAALDAIEAALP